VTDHVPAHTAERCPITGDVHHWCTCSCGVRTWVGALTEDEAWDLLDAQHVARVPFAEARERLRRGVTT
jgi:hypothetical protein